MADGLGADNIEALVFNMGLSKAIRSRIHSGIDLIQEMEEQAMISIDDLSQLKQMLEDEDLRRLAKIVGKYRDLYQKDAELPEKTQRPPSHLEDTG